MTWGVFRDKESGIRDRKESRNTGVASECWGATGDVQEVLLHVRTYVCRLPGVPSGLCYMQASI